MPSNSGPICLSVINMKGGVGKTTIATLLAEEAARGYRTRSGVRGEVMAIDLDPQSNLSQALMGHTRYEKFFKRKSPSIAGCLRGYQHPNDAVLHIRSRLDLLPSRFDFSKLLISGEKPDPQCLARLIAKHFQDKNLVIIDCAPTESILTQLAYHASRYILVPVKPEFLATIGFPLLNDSLKYFRQRYSGHQIDVIGVVVNHSTYDDWYGGGPETRRAKQEIIREAKKNGWRIFHNEIAYSRGFPKIMRGDFTWLGNSRDIWARFAEEFFSRPELSGLGLKSTR